jgi:alpha-L-fucosidase
MPPHADYRTPEYVTFDDVQRKPWECVRGMDQSFGYNAQSQPEHFLSRDELLWMLADIAAKGGNLLLNVGPRGVDAQIPDEQRDRLGWLAAWAVPNAAAIVGTRPWVVPGTATAEGHPLRYTARDDTVYAFVQGATGSVTLPDLRATTTTAVRTIDGTPLPWRDGPDGLTVDLPPREPGPEPSVVALHQVRAAGVGSR